MAAPQRIVGQGWLRRLLDPCRVAVIGATFARVVAADPPIIHR